MSDYVPTPQWLNQRPVPDDGAAPTAALFGLSYEDIYDRLEWLKEGNISTSGVTYTRTFSASHAIYKPDEWEWDSTLMALKQIDSALGSVFFDLPLRVPDGCRIAQVVLFVDPAAHGALPAQLPNFNLRAIDLNSSPGTISNLGGQTDSSGNAAAYSAAHSITRNWSAPDVLVSRSRDYALRVEGEYGANSVDNLRVFGAKVSIIASQRDGAAG